jgi:hypothetical protein
MTVGRLPTNPDYDRPGADRFRMPDLPVQRDWIAGRIISADAPPVVTDTALRRLSPDLGERPPKPPKPRPAGRDGGGFVSFGGR